MPAALSALPLGSSSSGYNQRGRQREQEREYSSSSDPQQPQMVQRQCLNGQMDHQRANSGSEKGVPLYVCLAVVVQYRGKIFCNCTLRIQESLSSLGKLVRLRKSGGECVMRLDRLSCDFSKRKTKDWKKAGVTSVLRKE
jgi:hypothetical protein